MLQASVEQFHKAPELQDQAHATGDGLLFPSALVIHGLRVSSWLHTLQMNQESKHTNTCKFLTYHGQGKTILTVLVNAGVSEVLTGISDAAPFARVGPRAAHV